MKPAKLAHHLIGGLTLDKAEPYIDLDHYTSVLLTAARETDYTGRGKPGQRDQSGAVGEDCGFLARTKAT